MENAIGTIYKFTIWGQSHSPEIGVVIEGVPAGTRINLDRLEEFLDRRRPGRDRFSTARKESDVPEFVSGFSRAANPAGGRILVASGAVVSAVIRNTDVRSADYEELRYVPRPSHADAAAMVRYGDFRDFHGGGQFSGRLTAPLCVAGGIAIQILEKIGIKVSAHLVRAGGETGRDNMLRAIDAARSDGDSVGGVVECVVENVPAGVGEPMFDGIENRISQTVFGIPAVKGIEFGSGFRGSDLRGSENNDSFFFAPGSPVFQDLAPDLAPDGDETDGKGAEDKDLPAGSLGGITDMTTDGTTDGTTDRAATQRILRCVRTRTNNHGGSLGGLSSGMPIVFRVAFKPTPSIAREQRSVDIRTGREVLLKIKGRHDPCVALRAVPAVEAAAASAVYDLIRIRDSEAGC